MLEAQAFLSKFGNISFTESSSFTSQEFNLVKEKVEEWTKDLQESENKRTSFLGQSISRAFSGIGGLFGKR